MGEHDANGRPPDEHSVDRSPEQADDRALWEPVKAAPMPPRNPGFLTNLMARLDEVDAEGEVVAAEARPAPTRRGGRRLRLAVAAAAAAAIAVGVVLIGLPGKTHVTPPIQATAAQRMVSAMDHGMANANALRAVVTYSRQSTPSAGGPTSLQVWQGPLVATTAGSARLALRLVQHVGSVPGTRSLALYDAQTRTRVLAWWQDDSASGTMWKRSWPTSMADWGAAGSWQLYLAQAAFVKAAAADHPGMSVAETTYQGRPAWTATMAAGPPNRLAVASPASASPASSTPSVASTLTVVVDEQTGLLLRSVLVAPGEYREELSLSDVRTDVQPRADAFARLPKGLHPHVWAVEWTSPQGRKVRVESYTHFASLGEAGEKTGFDPLIPTSTPPGYSLTDIASRPQQRVAAWFSQIIRTPPLPPRPGTPDGEIDIFYRQGFDWFQILQTSVASSDSTSSPQPSSESTSSAQAWDQVTSSPQPATESDTLQRLLDQVKDYPFAQTATLTSGTLDGAPARTWVSLTTGPGLAVVGKGYALMITGSLTREELLSLANSLAPYSAAP